LRAPEWREGIETFGVTHPSRCYSPHRLLFAPRPPAPKCRNFSIPASDKSFAPPTPDGWVLDAKATAENRVQIMVPKGQSFASAEPLIYVEVIYQPDKQQTLADFARLNNARWLAGNPRAKITELPVVERLSSKPAFLRFAFENPAKAQQAFEIGALGVDSDKDGNDFVLDVVMSANSKAALDRADAAYTAFLKAH
jgi:hypothetical protein